MIKRLKTNQKLRQLIATHPLISFTLLTYLLTISAAFLQFIANAFFNLGNAGNLLNTLIFTACPALSAIALTYTTDGQNGLRAILTKLKPQSKYLHIYLLMPCIMVLGFALILTYLSPSFSLIQLATPHFVFSFLSLLLTQIIIVGIGEELGWRGYLLAKALRRFTAKTATIIVFAVWSFWHIPKLLMMSEATMIAALLIGLLAFSIGFTWLYQKQYGNLTLIILMHSAFNSSIYIFESQFTMSTLSLAWLWFSIICLAVACIITLADRLWQFGGNPSGDNNK